MSTLICYSHHMKRAAVIIPESPLDIELGKLARLKTRASAMLLELENSAGYANNGASGGWRHNPLAWMNRTKK